MLKVFILLMMTLNSPTLKNKYDFCGKCFRGADDIVGADGVEYGSVAEGGAWYPECVPGTYRPVATISQIKKEGNNKGL